MSEFIKLGDVIVTQDQADQCKRITGKTISDWANRQSENLVKDLHSGRLDTSRPYLLHELNWMASRYGFDDEDIILAMEDYRLVSTLYPSHKFKPPIYPPGFTPTDFGYKRYMCYRLNPERFGHFAARPARLRNKNLVPQ